MDSQDCEVFVLANDLIQCVSHQSIAIKHPSHGVRYTVVELVIKDGVCAWVWQNMSDKDFKELLVDKHLKGFMIGSARFSIPDLKRCCDGCNVIGKSYSASSQNCQCFISQVLQGLGFVDPSKLPSGVSKLLAAMGVVLVVGGTCALVYAFPYTTLYVGEGVVGSVEYAGSFVGLGGFQTTMGIGATTNAELAMVGMGLAADSAAVGLAVAATEASAVDAVHTKSIQK